MTLEHAVRAGSVDDLQREGRLLTKVGSLPVLVVWHEGRAYAIEDRCPHLGFPLHQGTVEAGLRHLPLAPRPLRPGQRLHARPVGRRRHRLRRRASTTATVLVAARPDADPVGPAAAAAARRPRAGHHPRHWPRPRSGCSRAGGAGARSCGTALDFGTTYRDDGWGSGLTVLVAMANLLPHLDPADRPLALVHALAFVSRDTRGRAPRFPEPALGDGGHDLEQVGGWYRRFVETRSSDAAERALATIVARRRPAARPSA